MDDFVFLNWNVYVIVVIVLNIVVLYVFEGRIVNILFFKRV